MLKSWQVKHFKSIVEARTLEPGYVTILTGLNNAGKSSVLQSLLMIAGTLSSPLKKHPLLPLSVNQSEMDRDILSDAATDQTLSFNFELILSIKKAANIPVQGYQTGSCICRAVKVAVSFRFERDNQNTRHAGDQGGGRFFASSTPVMQSLEITFPAMNEGDEEIVFCLDNVSEQMKQDSLPQVFAHNYRLAHSATRLPYYGYFSVNGQPMPGKYQVLDFIHFLPRGLRLSPPTTEHTTKEVKQLESKYLTLLTDTVDQIKHFFSQQVHYLGPQRTNASPSQPSKRARKNRYDKVGSKGEYAAALYHNRHAEDISWYNPERQQIMSSSLEDAVNCWMQYLGIASSVTTQQIGHGPFRWLVKQQPDGEFHPLSVGGNSICQVLPLLVLGLLASPGSLLLVEQPELFLHQSAQALLGDFFVGLATCGKQSLIETQSENLVAQLRYHIVREGGQDPDRYMLYFADRDDKGFARFTSIEISPRGAIVNWPEGFFSETLIQEENIRFTYMKKKFEAQAQDADKRRVVQQGGEQAQDAEHFG